MDTNEKKYLTLLAKVLSHEASAEEKQALEAWTKEDSEHQAFVKDINKTWDLTGNYAENIPVNTDAAWAKFENKLSANTVVAKKTTVFKLPVILKAAAVVLLAVSTVLWYYNNNTSSLITEVSTQNGEQKELRLPDGSIVTLNENSTLAYNNGFENRLVNLKGEAFFDVVKQDGQTFEILTSTTKTTVLGTSFNVRAYAQQATEVAVFTGKVAVEELTNKNNKVLLLPNERAVYLSNSTIQKTSNSDSNQIAWKTQELVFDNTELKVLIKTLERYFEVEIGIENENVLNCHFTGRFDKPQLKEIVESIAFSNDLEVKKVNEKYILIGQGCE